MLTSAANGSSYPAGAASSTIENLQALRGIAALLVVWAHLKWPLTDLCPNITHNTFIKTAHGSIGVDLFFIISGFVICLTACKRHHQPLDFFLARIARVAPLYLVATIGFVALNYPKFWPNPSWLSFWNGFFYLPLFDTSVYTVPPLPPGWTLSFEMWFYIAFALGLNLGKPDRVALFFPAIFCSGAVLMTFYHGDWYLPRFLFHPFVLEFAFGCIVFQTQKWIGGRMSWILLTAGIAYMLAFNRETGYLGWAAPMLGAQTDLAWLRVLLWGFPCAMIVAGLVGVERNQGLILPRFLIWFGGLSYSLYLSHFFSMRFVVLAAQLVHVHRPVVVIVALVGGILFFGWAVWRWIETPLTRSAQAWVKNRVPSSHLEATRNA